MPDQIACELRSRFDAQVLKEIFDENNIIPTDRARYFVTVVPRKDGGPPLGVCVYRVDVLRLHDVLGLALEATDLGGANACYLVEFHDSKLAMSPYWPEFESRMSTGQDSSVIIARACLKIVMRMFLRSVRPNAA
jgi:hypothetical protein